MYAFAAAGTGGHVYPALAVADQLVAAGADREDIVFFGGHRMESRAVPAAGYTFVELDLQGLKRSLSPSNLRLPFVVSAAAGRVRRELERRGTRVLLATGGYVTVPAGWGARRARVPLFLQEQNAAPGLANRMAARWAERVFLAFPAALTRLPGEVVGNPLRPAIGRIPRTAQRKEARSRYGLAADATVIGILGGSLGAAALNRLAAVVAFEWEGPEISLLHVAGPDHAGEVERRAAGAPVPWRVVPFENRMEDFYAACDIVICRGGGLTISELAATATPAVIVPRPHTAAHQHANAAYLVDGGAALLCEQEELAELPRRLAAVLADPERLDTMRGAAAELGRPDAARIVAAAMLEAVNG